MVDEQELEQVREEYQRHKSAEQQKIKEAAITYFRRKLQGEDVSVKRIATEYHISFWKLRSVIKGSATQAQEEN